MNDTPDTCSLQHLILHLDDHLRRVQGGAIERVTVNGQAAMVIMSPERYDFLVHSAERGHIWRDAIDRYDDGDGGTPLPGFMKAIETESERG